MYPPVAPVKKLHEAVCQAVALLNRAPELARSTEGREIAIEACEKFAGQIDRAFAADCGGRQAEVEVAVEDPLGVDAPELVELAVEHDQSARGQHHDAPRRWQLGEAHAGLRALDHVLLPEHAHVAAEQARQHTGVHFVVDTLEFLHRGGRLMRDGRRGGRDARGDRPIPVSLVTIATGDIRVSNTATIAAPIHFGNAATVTVNGESIKLTGHEYKLLSYMIHHMNKIVSRTELTEHIYDQDFDRDSNTIEVFVTRIRKKLGAEVITTIRGLGYSLDDPAGPGRG